MATPKNLSVIRAFAILGAFDGEHREMGAAEVAAKVGFTPATTHRFLLTLEDLGAVTRTPGGRFQLGMTLADLGGRVAPHKVLADAAAEPIARLVRAFQETVHVAVLADGDVVIVASQASTRALRIETQVGRRLPAYCTALGKVLLAGLDDAGLDAYLAATTLGAKTARTITTQAALKRALALVREAGFADDNEETEDGLRAFSVPIADRDGIVRAALAVMGPSSRLNDRDRADVARTLATAAADIAARVFPANTNTDPEAA